MRKLFVAAIAAAVAVTGFAVIANAGKGEAGTSLDLALKPKKVDKAAGMDVVFEPTKVDDQGTADTSDDVYTPTDKNTIRLPRKSSVDTKARKRCKLTPSEVGQGQNCPKKTRLGAGSTVTFVGGQPLADEKRQGGVPLNGTIEVYNLEEDLLLVVQSCQPGTGPTTDNECVPASQRVVLTGAWRKVATWPKLVVETPSSLHANGIVITRLELNVDKHTKTVKVGGKEVLRAFLLTPETCGGKWKSQVKTNFTDGTKQTIVDKQKCKKPVS